MTKTFSASWQNIFGLRSLCFCQDFQNYLLLLLKNSLRVSFFLGKKLDFVAVFGTLIEKFSGICYIFLNKVVKTDFHVHIGTFWVWNFQESFIFFPFWIVGRIFPVFGRKSFDMVVKRAFYESWEKLSGQSLFSWKNYFFSHFWRQRKRFRLILLFFGQKANFFDLLAQFSNMVVRFVFDVSIGTLWRKLFFFWTKHICVFNSFGQWPNFFGPHGKKCLALQLSFFNSIVKTAFYLSRRTVRGNDFSLEENKLLTFSDTDWKNLGQLSNIFGRGCQNRFLRELRYILSLKKSENILTFYRFPTLVEKVSTWISKMLFTSPEKTSRIIAFSVKKLLFSHFRRQRKKMISAVWQKLVSAEFSKPHSTCPKERFEEKKQFFEKFFYSFLSFRTKREQLWPSGTAF